VPAKARGEICESSVIAKLGLVAAKAVARCCPGARGVFPFCLGRQSISLAGPASDPRHIRLRLIPADADCRMRSRKLEVGLAKRAVGLKQCRYVRVNRLALIAHAKPGLRNESPKLIDGNFEPPQCKALGDDRAPLRPLSLLSSALALRRAHDEPPHGQLHHFR